VVITKARKNTAWKKYEIVNLVFLFTIVIFLRMSSIDKYAFKIMCQVISFTFASLTSPCFCLLSISYFFRNGNYNIRFHKLTDLCWLAVNVGMFRGSPRHLFYAFLWWSQLTMMCNWERACVYSFIGKYHTFTGI
jgi:hypothetical protein